MSQLNIAVLGGGRLGTIHARLLQQLPDVQLAGIFEPEASRASELANEFGCPVATRLEQLLEVVPIDAAIVAAPTTQHHALGVTLLQRGIHLLIEKPLAPTVAECEELVVAAEQHATVLQVGHVERFSPIWDSVCKRIGEPRLIDARREAPLTLRSMDVGVVLDLMIHDIDLIVSLVQAPIVSVQAVGFNWTGPREDVAHARLTFGNGCVAQLAASRVSCVATRTMTIHGTDWYSQVDFSSRTGVFVQGPTHMDWQSRCLSAQDRELLTQRLYDDILNREELTAIEANPILEELRDFVHAIRSKGSPRVSGSVALHVVEIANEIVQRIEQRNTGTSQFRRPQRKAG